MAARRKGIRSMTGFGAGRRTGKGFGLDLEVRAVNHRFLQVKIRVPREAAYLEGPLEEGVRKRVRRGSLTLRVDLERTAPPGTLLDREYLASYVKELKGLEKELGIPAGLDLARLVELPGVVLESQGPDPREVRKKALQALGEALDQLEEMRLREGAALVADMEKRRARMGRLLGRIRKLAPQVQEKARKRLAGRLEEVLAPFLEGKEQGDRVYQEAAFLLEKMDFTEEVVRLESHLAQWEHLVEKGGEVGKRLEFLLQEMGREINTLGTKAGDVGIAHLVVELKAEAEKLKEQVQNLE